jgi:hypothetical protein
LTALAKSIAAIGLAYLALEYGSAACAVGAGFALISLVVQKR